MENYTCQNCGREIPECNRTLHGLSCKNTITHDEFQDLIPCEYCNHLISFGDYNNHIQHCDAQMSFVPRFSSLLTTPLLTPGHFTSRFNTAIENTEQEQTLLPPPPPLHPPLLPPPPPEPYEYDFFSALDEILDRIQNENLINIPNINPEGIDNYQELTELGETIGNVVVGLSDNQDYLMPKQYTNGSPFKCEICQTNKLETFITECNHEFCQDCCTSWFESSKKCPYCNLELKKLQK